MVTRELYQLVQCSGPINYSITLVLYFPLYNQHGQVSTLKYSINNFTEHHILINHIPKEQLQKWERGGV